MGKFRFNSIETVVEGLKLGIFVDYVFEVRKNALATFLDTEKTREEFAERFTLHGLLEMAMSAAEEGCYLGDYYARVLSASHMHNVATMVRRGATHRPKMGIGDTMANYRIKSELVESSEASAIASRDAYLPQETLAFGCMPLDSGDVFELVRKRGDGSSEAALYMALAQPCGMAMRPNGTRKVNFITMARLVKCQRHTKGSHKGEKVKETGVFADLPPFVKDDGDFVDGIDHRDTISICDNVVDLCVLNSDGVARYRTDGKFDAPPIDVGWKPRRKMLEEWAASNLKAWDEMQPLFKEGGRLEKRSDDIAGLLWGLPHSSRIAISPKFDHFEIRDFVEIRDTIRKVKINKGIKINNIRYKDTYFSENEIAYVTGSIEFGIRRVARLRSEYSYGALVEYARYYSRPAFPGPLVRRY